MSDVIMLMAIKMFLMIKGEVEICIDGSVHLQSIVNNVITEE